MSDRQRAVAEWRGNIYNHNNDSYSVQPLKEINIYLGKLNQSINSVSPSFSSSQGVMELGGNKNLVQLLTISYCNKCTKPV